MATAAVLLSGGVDSSTCLAMACKDHGGSNVTAMSVYYGQRHTKEIHQAGLIANHFGAIHNVMNLESVIGKGGLTDPDQEVPNARYDELPYGVSPTYVPFRNGLLLAALASRMAPDEEMRALYIGTHAEDGDNWAYPDCTPEFIGGMANAIYVGTYQRVRLITPLLFMRKHEVVREGTRLGVPWHLTWSCYKGKDLHCGVCPTCQARMSAFADAGVPDPTGYSYEKD